MKKLSISMLTMTFCMTINVINPINTFAQTNFADAVRAERMKENHNPYQEKDFAEAVREARIKKNQQEINESDRTNQIKEIFTADKNYFTYKSFIVSHNPKIQKNEVDKIIKNVNYYSNKNNLDPKLVLALIAKESSFRPHAVSHTGAMGLGQLKDFTAKEVGVKNPFNIVENIKGTTKYLGKLMKYFNGDIYKTLASYNMGAGAVERTLKSGNKLPVDVQHYVYKINNFKNTI